MVERKLSKEDKESLKVVTPLFRVSYPHLLKPMQLKKTDKPKYSVTMLFPKNADLSEIKAAIRNAKVLKYGPKENWPEDLQSPVSDGDNKKFKDKVGYAGHWVIKASTAEEYPPGVVDQKNRPITDAAKIYSGCYARAYIYANAWEFAGKEGVSFILDYVQFSHDGEAIGGGKKPADQVFTPLSTGDDEDDVSEDELEDF